MSIVLKVQVLQFRPDVRGIWV